MMRARDISMSHGRTRGPGPLGPLLVVLLLLTAYVPSDVREVDTGPLPATGASLTVTDWYQVSGVETYDQVRLGTTGSLVIPKDATLVGTVLIMEGASRLEMTGGSLLLRGGTGDETPSLLGSCQHMDSYI